LNPPSRNPPPRRARSASRAAPGGSSRTSSGAPRVSETVSLSPVDNRALANVCGPLDENLRQIEAALALYARQNPGAEPPRVTWRPFQLNPQLPPGGMSRQDYVTQKFGAARSKDVYARVAGVGLQHGIAFAFDKIVRQPNTVAAHSLIALAAAPDGQPNDLQGRVKEAFLHAYFLDGVDLTKPENLVEIAVGAGLDRAQVEQCLADPLARTAVEQEEARARAIGVEGVPFFIFNGKLAVSGAQGAEALLGAMRQAEAKAA